MVLRARVCRANIPDNSFLLFLCSSFLSSQNAHMVAVRMVLSGLVSGVKIGARYDIRYDMVERPPMVTAT